MVGAFGSFCRAPDVRFGSEADIAASLYDVRFVPLADVAHLATLLVAIVHRETSAPQRASRVAQGLTARPLR